MDKHTQNQKILKHLQKGKKLTPLQALSKFGCLRLSGRIFDLKKQGHKIKTDIIAVNKKHVGQYSLEK